MGLPSSLSVGGGASSRYASKPSFLNYTKKKKKKPADRPSSLNYTTKMASSPSKKKERTTSYSSQTDDISVLENIAQKKGYKLEKDKPSFFNRVMDIISRPLYASAGAAKAVIKGENVLKEAYKGFTGEEKETYSDVLESAGVKNKYIRGGVGLALDIVLDPTTYFGGSLIKGAGKGVSKVGSTAFKGLEKVRPESAANLAEGAKKIKEGVGGLFSVYSGRSKELVDKGFEQMNKISIAKEDIVNSYIKLGKELSPKQLEEMGDTLIAHKRKLQVLEKESGSREAAKKALNKLKPEFQDPEVAKAYNKIIKPKIKEIGKKTGLPEETLLADYYPSISRRRVKLNKTGVGTGAGVGNEGYKKLDKGVMKVKEIINNPIEAYSRRDFEVTKNNLNRAFLKQMVDDYGKPFKSKLDAAENGYVMLKEKGKFGKELGYLKEGDAKFLNTITSPEYNAIDMFAKGVGYDKFTNLFKTAVTAYFPAFHIRNAISGLVQNYQVLGVRAFAPANIQSALAVLKGSEKTAMQFPKWKGTAKELNKIFRERFTGSSRYISDLGDYISEIGSNSFKLKKLSNARQIGNFIESNQKAMAVVTALRKGHTIKEAFALAEKAGFDYSKITGFERSVMKRVIPFYSFAKNNAKLQVGTMIHNPERILNQVKVANALSNAIGSKVTEEDIKGLPEWALSGLGFKVKDGKYVSSLGLPVEEFIGRINKPIMSTLSSMNPLVKFPLESKLGFDFFREQKIVDIDKVAPATGEILWKLQEEGKLPDWMASSLNIKKYKSPYDNKYKYTMSPKALHILRNLPTARLQNTLEKMFDKDMDKVNKYMAFFSGGKVYDIDVETQKFFKERDMVEDMKKYLQDRGVGQTFENYYIKK